MLSMEKEFVFQLVDFNESYTHKFGAKKERRTDFFTQTFSIYNNKQCKTKSKRCWEQCTNLSLIHI